MPPQPRTAAPQGRRRSVLALRNLVTAEIRRFPQLLGHFADAKARRVVVGPDAPTGVVLELNLRDADQARAIAEQLREAAFRAGSERAT